MDFLSLLEHTAKIADCKYISNVRNHISLKNKGIFCHGNMINFYPAERKKLMDIYTLYCNIFVILLFAHCIVKKVILELLRVAALVRTGPPCPHAHSGLIFATPSC
jgi:hypothetical protein